SHSQFTFTPAADVERVRCGIGSDPRNMDEPLNACPLGVACEPLGRFHMQGMKCLCPAFKIEADGIHHAISSSDGCRNRGFVVDIGAYRLQRGPSGGTWRLPSASRLIPAWFWSWPLGPEACC